MADLISTDEGRLILRRIACFLGKERMSKNLPRNFYRAFDGWKNTGHFDFSTLIGDLNAITQDELTSLNDLLGELGCLDSETIDDMTIHVNATTGSDETGDGSSTQPYASLAFLAYLPKTINHSVRILIESNLTASFIDLAFDFGVNGSLSIIGVGTPSTITTSAGAGPFTLTGVTAHGTSRYAFDLATGTTFGVDELYGKWIKMLTGDAAGECLPVHSNTANNIFTRTGWTLDPAIGDTFQIIQPLRTLTVQGINIANRGPIAVKDTSLGARFSMVNLNVDVRGTVIDDSAFALRNQCESLISFVSLISTNTEFNFCKIDSNMNRWQSIDTSVATLADSDIENLDVPFSNGTCCGLALYRDTFPPATFGFDELIIGNNAREVGAFDTRGRTAIEGAYGAQVTRCGLGVIIGRDGASCGLFLALITGDASGYAIKIEFGNSWDVDVSYIHATQDAFSLENCSLHLGDSITKGTISGYGFIFLQGHASVYTQASPAALVGTTGSIWFPGGVGATAFPAADAAASDSLGNLFAYISTP